MANSSNDGKSSDKKPYEFGGISDFNLEQIENEILNDSVYLDVFAGSDVRFKEDAYPLENSLETVKKLNAFTYKYKTEEFPENDFPKERVSGLMAQDLEKVVPLAVKSDGNDYKYVNYASLAPILIEAVKELTAKVEAQEEVIKELQKKLK